MANTNTNKLNKLIIRAVEMFETSFFLILDKQKVYIKWCRCWLSGLVGLVLILNFLNTENKVSKAGNHNITTMNKTENSDIFLKKSIHINPILHEIAYAPESPIKLLFKILKTNNIIRISNVVIIKDKL